MADVHHDKLKFPLVGQGPAKVGNSEDILNESDGYTNPNLHRRIADEPTLMPNEHDKQYHLGIYNVDSYRMTETVLHDEESTTCEIP